AENPSPAPDVLIVGKPAARPGTGLHHDLPAVIGQLGDAVGLHRNPTFLVLDFLRYTNHQHGHTRSPSFCAPLSSLRRAPHYGGAKPLPPAASLLEASSAANRLDGRG